MPTARSAFNAVADEVEAASVAAADAISPFPVAKAVPIAIAAAAGSPGMAADASAVIEAALVKLRVVPAVAAAAASALSGVYTLPEPKASAVTTLVRVMAVCSSETCAAVGTPPAPEISEANGAKGSVA